MKRLHLSPDLSLPIEAVTETFALLAVRGAGKTNAARVMAEEMFAAGAPFVAVDPVGSWYGLRAGRDAKTPGLSVPIFGGKRGDVPLEKGGGNIVADLVVDQRISCVLDLSTFDSEASKKAFLLDFARRLYLRNEQPLHLFLEEADDYIPQRPMRDELQLLRAWENIVRRGRSRGLGITMITQRSASINKSVLTQAGTLIAMRTTSPQDRAAVEAWVKYHGEKEELLASLAGLANGEAWVWSPQLLKRTVRVQFRLSHTFDSGETPKFTGKAAATLADVDLDEIQRRMADTIEKAKAEDPKLLRAEVVKLRRELAAKPAAGPPPKVERVEVPVLTEAQVKRLEAADARLEKALGGALEKLQAGLAAAGEARREIAAALRAFAGRPAATAATGPRRDLPPPDHGARRAVAPATPAPRREKAPPAADGGAVAIGRGGDLRMLKVLAQFPDGMSASRLALQTVIAKKGGTFRTYLGKLRTAGYVEGDSGLLRITPAGVEAAGDFDPMPTGEALLDHWRRELGASGMRAMFDALVAVYPAAMTRAELSEATNIAEGGGTFRTYLGKLRTLELVEGSGELRASSDLFEEGA